MKTTPDVLNILGTDYNFSESKEELDSRLEDCEGYHDGYAKIICVNNDYNENHSDAIRNFTEYKNKIKRHEIIHAFLYESGLRKWSDDELLVEWLAIQFPKMLSTFQKVDCI